MKIKMIKECQAPSYKGDFIAWDADEGRKNRIATYRRYAGVDEDFEITEANLSDYALNWTSSKCNCSKDRVKAEVLGEDWNNED